MSKEFNEGMKRLSEQEDATLFITLLAAFQALLYRYTGQADIAVGTLTAGRNRVETEGLIGFFVNTLVLRTDVGGNPSFRELVRRVKETALGAYGHSDLPFEKLVEEMHPERDLSRNPLVQVMLTVQNAPWKGVTAAGGDDDLGWGSADDTVRSGSALMGEMRESRWWCGSSTAGTCLMRRR